MKNSERQLSIYKSSTVPFSQEDLKNFTLKTPLQTSLEKAFTVSGKNPSEYKILDVGCGRGLTIANLLQLGFDVYGAEATKKKVDLAKRGLAAVGENSDRVIQLNLKDGSYPLPSESFDFIYSDNVIEHVTDLTVFVEEISRMTKPDGAGFHIFPSKWKPVEVHLRIPFVHFLPKNRFRYYAIRLAMSVGFDPEWVRNSGKRANEAAEDYYWFLNDDTYYRSLSTIKKQFKTAGLEVNTHATGERVLDKFLVNNSTVPFVVLASKLSTLFHTTILTTHKPLLK